MKPYNEHGTVLTKHAPCPRCDEDEIGSHYDAAWCCACGWRGKLADLSTNEEAAQ